MSRPLAVLLFALSPMIVLAQGGPQLSYPRHTDLKTSLRDPFPPEPNTALAPTTRERAGYSSYEVPSPYSHRVVGVSTFPLADESHTWPRELEFVRRSHVR